MSRCVAKFFYPRYSTLNGFPVQVRPVGFYMASKKFYTVFIRLVVEFVVIDFYSLLCQLFSQLFCV